MIIFGLLLGFFLVAVGGYGLFAKYQVVIGGTLCHATVERCEYASSSRGFTSYMLIMGFTWEGEYLEKRSLNTTFSPDKATGKQYQIYYNPRHPNRVVNKGAGLDFLAATVMLVGAVYMAAVLYAM